MTIDGEKITFSNRYGGELVEFSPFLLRKIKIPTDDAADVGEEGTVFWNSRKARANVLWFGTQHRPCWDSTIDEAPNIQVGTYASALRHRMSRALRYKYEFLKFEIYHRRRNWFLLLWRIRRPAFRRPSIRPICKWFRLPNVYTALPNLGRYFADWTHPGKRRASY